MTDLRLVLCTCPNEEVAKQLASLIVNEKLAGCVNIIPGIRSIYIWEGKTEDSSECLLIIKTTQHIYPTLEKRIKENHPYDCPEIIGLPIEHCVKGYLQWIQNSVSLTI